MTTKLSCDASPLPLNSGSWDVCSVCCINTGTNPSQQCEDTNNMLHRLLALEKKREQGIKTSEYIFHAVELFVQTCLSWLFWPTLTAWLNIWCLFLIMHPNVLYTFGISLYFPLFKICKGWLEFVKQEQKDFIVFLLEMCYAVCGLFRQATATTIFKYVTVFYINIHTTVKLIFITTCICTVLNSATKSYLYIISLIYRPSMDSNRAKPTLFSELFKTTPSLQT